MCEEFVKHQMKLLLIFPLYCLCWVLTALLRGPCTEPVTQLAGSPAPQGRSPPSPSVAGSWDRFHLTLVSLLTHACTQCGPLHRRSPGRRVLSVPGKCIGGPLLTQQGAGSWDARHPMLLFFPVLFQRVHGVSVGHICSLTPCSRG